MFKNLILNRVKSKIESFVKDCDNKSINNLLTKLPQGKMLRSKLILKIAGVSDDSIALCAVVEMIHAASLLHDDVIDDSLTRRGQDSLNAIYGNKTSIMFGDVLYSKAFEELSNFPKEISQTISNAVVKLSIGEIMDVELTDKFNSNQDVYMDMIYKKTASLIEASAKSAAILSNKDSSIFALYGKNLGLAFQIVDDILDITQDSTTLGKPAMHDFYEGKVTLPYLLLYSKSNKDTKHKIESLYKKSLSTEDEKWLNSLLVDSGAISESIEYAKKLGYEAIDTISTQKDIKELKDVMLQMIDREF